MNTHTPITRQIQNNEPLLEALQKPIIKEISPHTERAYRTDWQIFGAWCEKNGEKCMPASPRAIAYFLIDQSNRKLSPNTLLRRLSTIKFIHENNQIDYLPTETQTVRNTMRNILLANAGNITPYIPITETELQLIIDGINNTNERNILRTFRDKAILLLGYYGALKPVDLILLKTEDITFEQDKLTLTIEGEGKETMILDINRRKDKKYCPIHAIKQWLEKAEIKSGFVFKSINRHHQLAKDNSNKPDLSAYAISIIIKKYAKLINLDSKNIVGLSLRQGFITDAIINNESPINISKFTRLNIATILQYYKKLEGLTKKY